MVNAMKLNLTRAIGVSNFNSTHMQDLLDANLPLPAVNQIQWFPGMLAPGGVPFQPYPYGETFEALRVWCDEHGVLVNGYSPFGGNGQAGKTFSEPGVAAVAAMKNLSAAQVILRWNVQLGIAVNPQATNPAYQQENLDIWGFNLTEAEMNCIGSLDPTACPPAPPTPAQQNCTFSFTAAAAGGANAGAGGNEESTNTIVLKGLPAQAFNLTDRLGDEYIAASPCRNADGTTAPAVESRYSPHSTPPIPLGYLSDATAGPLPTGEEGMRLVLGGGSGNPGCNHGRTLWYDFYCAKQEAQAAGPNATMFIYSDPRYPNIPDCVYRVEWHTPLACYH